MQCSRHPIIVCAFSGIGNFDSTCLDYRMLIYVRGGKSTLIKALIRNAALNVADAVPIPGSHGERYKSTSGGIHLYSDPKTIDTDVPLFYAGSSMLLISDCY